MADRNSAPRPRPKIDGLTLIVFIIIGVIFVFVCLLMGAAFDYSLTADGKIDINKVENAANYLMKYPSKIFAQLGKGGYAPKMLFLGFMVIGIFALYKYSADARRLHRRGTEHGSAKWGNKKEMRLLADREKPQLVPIKIFDKYEYTIEWNKHQKWEYTDSTFTLLTDNGDLMVSFQVAEEIEESDPSKPDSEELQTKLQVGTEIEITDHPDKKKIGQHCIIESERKSNGNQTIEAVSSDGHRVFDHKGNFMSVKIDNNVLLTKELSLSLNGFQHGLNHNVLIIGGSGAGKTRYYAEPNIMQMNTSYVVTDPKGEILMKCGEMLRAAGYKVRVFNTIEMEHSNNYNPFHYVFDEKGQVSEVKVKKMINVLFESTKGDGEKDDMWQQKGRTVIEAIVFLLFEESEYHAQRDENGLIIPETRDETHLNFFSVTEKMRKLQYLPHGSQLPDGFFLTPNEGESEAEFEARRANAFLSPLDKDFLELQKRKPDSMALLLYKEIRNAPEETGQGFLTNATTKTSPFNMKDIKNLTCCDNIHLEMMGDEKTALFIIISATDRTFNFLAAMLFTQLFDTLTNRANFRYKGRLPVHVRCIIDEFANIGQIPDFDLKIAFVRSMGMSLNVILQAQSQLKSRYEKTWETIIGCCDTFLFLGGQEESTLKSLSEKLGKETIDVKGQNRTRGRQSSTSENNSILGRELLQTNELNTMSVHDCIVMMRSHHPFYCTKYPLEKHPNYRFLGDDDGLLPLFDVSTIHSVTITEFAAEQAAKRKKYEKQEEKRNAAKLKKEESASKVDTPVNFEEETGEIPYTPPIKKKANPYFSSIGDTVTEEEILTTFEELEEMLRYEEPLFSANIAEEVYADDEPRFGAAIGDRSSYDFGEPSAQIESEVKEDEEEAAPIPSVIEEDGSITEPETSEEPEDTTEIHYDSSAELAQEPESYDDLSEVSGWKLEGVFTEEFPDGPETDDYDDGGTSEMYF